MFHQNENHQVAVPASDPDIALLQSMAAGDTTAIGEFYDRYSSLVLGFLSMRLGNRQQAEEVLQDVMLAIWENAHTFEARSKVKTWVLTIARNRAINATRRKQFTLVNVNDVFGLESSDTGPVEALERNEKQQQIRHAIRQLPEGQREVLVLVFYHQMTGAEVAQILDISEGTVKSRLHRAKENLKGLLAREGSWE